MPLSVNLVSVFRYGQLRLPYTIMTLTRFFCVENIAVTQELRGFSYFRASFDVIELLEGQRCLLSFPIIALLTNKFTHIFGRRPGYSLIFWHRHHWPLCSLLFWFLPYLENELFLCFLKRKIDHTWNFRSGMKKWLEEGFTVDFAWKLLDIQQFL